MNKPTNKKPKTTPKQKPKQKTPPKERILTREDFLRVLKKATRPIPSKPKASHGKEKSGT